MRTAKSFYLTLMLVAGQIFSSALAHDSVNVDHKNDEAAIRAQADDYVKAFAAADIATLADMWAADAVYTDALGNVYRGREAIKEQMSGFFKQFGKQRFNVTIESLEFPSENTAIEQGTTKLIQSAAPQSSARYTTFHIKRDGKWQMLNVSESFLPQSMPKPESLVDDLGWLVGSWTAKSPQGTLRLKFDWIGDKKMIRSESICEAADGSKSTDVQIIYWNPLRRQICSWQCGSNGGYGEAWWEKTNKSFVAHARSTETDGCIAWADYIIKPENKDTFTWQSTGRHLLGSPLDKQFPDTGVIKVSRDQG
ncbi:MAG: SgcJ/EcaC family oxidoreductase [Candidatus Obscuribacterales bacterium]|nr:SgcJ/EcaC family oxidoreductase [Candidatus Obscuribacterales bacterium]